MGENICKKKKNLKIPKWPNLKNGQITWIDIFLKSHPNGKRYMHRCLAPLITRGMKIKPTMRSHFTPVRMAIIKKAQDKCWWECDEKETLMHSW